MAYTRIAQNLSYCEKEGNEDRDVIPPIPPFEKVDPGLEVANPISLLLCFTQGHNIWNLTISLYCDR